MDINLSFQEENMMVEVQLWLLSSVICQPCCDGCHLIVKAARYHGSRRIYGGTLSWSMARNLNCPLWWLLQSCGSYSHLECLPSFNRKLRGSSCLAEQSPLQRIIELSGCFCFVHYVLLLFKLNCSRGLLSVFYFLTNWISSNSVISFLMKRKSLSGEETDRPT